MFSDPSNQGRSPHMIESQCDCPCEDPFSNPSRLARSHSGCGTEESRYRKELNHLIIENIRQQAYQDEHGSRMPDYLMGYFRYRDTEARDDRMEELEEILNGPTDPRSASRVNTGTELKLDGETALPAPTNNRNNDHLPHALCNCSSHLGTTSQEHEQLQSPLNMPGERRLKALLEAAYELDHPEATPSHR